MRALLFAAIFLAACASRVEQRGDPPLPAQPGMPLVAGRIAAEKTTFIVDTGALVSVIDKSLAATAKLATVGSPPDITHTERPQIQLVGWGPVVDKPAAVLALPPSFTELGIGAIVSPQWMSAGSGRAAVVDLIHGTIADEAWESATRRLESIGPELSAPVALCQTSGVLPGRALVVDAQIDGVAVRLELDTGASATYVVESSPAGKHLAERAAGPVTVTAGHVSRSLTVERRPGASDGDCRTEGRMGIDVLKSCVIVTDGERLTARCAP